ncbi:hypothetical protein QBC38DRAFT_493879 [Podospora fimiseda]|uniref:Zn(2)-C6 fungal-type domain-containing protein n=1 Tax=Podospora fimiseda TaxID=252190 RepID=A0AAN6YJU5_9PEZI|nr:hypothetical protein QBC38DRAFT_493879 [Podospora fimiseda]
MPFHPIAPAPKAQHATSSSRSPVSHITTNLPKRRDVVRKACVPCKIRKGKCSSGQPCTQCTVRDNADECLYEQSQEEILRMDNARLEKLVRELEGRLAQMKNEPVDIANPSQHLFPNDPYGPDGQAFPPASSHTSFLSPHTPFSLMGGSSNDLSQATNTEMLLNLPSQPSSVSLLHPLHLLPQLPSSRLDREAIVFPLPQNSLAYELSICHPCVYPALAPPDGELLGVQISFDSASQQGQINFLQSINPPLVGLGLTLCDPRLVGLEISGQWTKVSIDNILTVELISRYLETDHPIVVPFDADLFLDGLSTHNYRYCSPLLVTAILAWSCQAYATSYPDLPLKELATLFMSEADHLFWQFQSPYPITHVSAAIILDLCSSVCGRSEESKKYRAATLEIGKTLNLVGTPSHATQEDRPWVGYATDDLRAMSHTAWALFLHQTHIEMHTCTSTVAGPPLLPLPGRDPYMGPDGLLAILPYPLHVGTSYVVDLDLALLIHEANKQSYGVDNNGVHQQQSLEQAELCFQRLLAWSTALPFGCARGDQNTPAILMMHMYFHGAVTAIFQPFIQGPLQNLPLQTFTSKGSVLSAFNSSVDQLKRLVIAYRRNFELQTHDTVLTMFGAAYLASVLCQLGPSKERNDVLERRHYFALCISAMLTRFPQFLSFKTVMSGLISVGLSTRTITTDYAKAVLADIARRGGAWQDSLDHEIDSEMVVDFELALTDRSLATATNMSSRLVDIDGMGGV